MSETLFWLISLRSTAFTEELPQKTLHLADYLISRSNRWEGGEGGGACGKTEVKSWNKWNVSTSHLCMRWWSNRSFLLLFLSGRAFTAKWPCVCACVCNSVGGRSMYTHARLCACVWDFLLRVRDKHSCHWVLASAESRANSLLDMWYLRTHTLKPRAGIRICLFVCKPKD